MHIHRTTPQDVWNRVKVARRVLKKRAPGPGPISRRDRFAIQTKAYVMKMKGTPSGGTEIFPLEIAWSFVGSLLGMLALTWCNRVVFGRSDDLLLMATFGASAMLLFGAPHVPFSQPRNVFGGHVVSALTGITVVTLLGQEFFFTPALAVAGAIVGMHATATLHPPGGGTALFMATGSPMVAEFGLFSVLFPVATGAAILLVVALLVNNLARGRRYPVSWW